MATKDELKYLDVAHAACPRCGFAVIGWDDACDREPDMVEWQGRCLKCGLEFVDVAQTLVLHIGAEVHGELYQSDDQVRRQAAAEMALELYKAMTALVVDLTEAHADELVNDHHGDRGECTYCKHTNRAVELMGRIESCVRKANYPEQHAAEEEKP